MTEPGPTPLPVSRRDTGIGAVMDRRRSIRRFGTDVLPLEGLASALWAGYGHRTGGGRTVPSAHARYGLGVTVVAGNVEGLAPAVYAYDDSGHALRLLRTGDYRAPVADASLVDSEWLGGAAAFVLITGDIAEANDHFADQPPLGRRGERYVWLEAGHVGQNLYLAAAGCGLGAVLVAGLDDARLLTVVGGLVTPGHGPLALVALGVGPLGSPDDTAAGG